MREERTVRVEGKLYTVVLSDRREILLAERDAGRAVIAVLGKGPERQAGHDRTEASAEAPADVSAAAYAVEDLEDVTETYLEQVVRRHLGLPWTIAETERLLIREFTEQDAASVPRDEIYSPGDEIFTVGERLADYVRCQYGFYGYGIWAVVEKTGGALAGKAGISDVEYGDGSAETELPSLQIELGYHIFKPFRRRGYASEACRGILGAVQKVMGERPYEVRARTGADNPASAGVIRACGLRGIIGGAET